MLNVLTFRNRGNLTVTGGVKVNGKEILEQSELAAISAYVEQDDIFIGTLKVKEHLKFQVINLAKDINSRREFNNKFQKKRQCLEWVSELLAKKKTNALKKF